MSSRNRFNELYRKRGFWGLTRKVATKPFRMLKKKWLYTFQNYNYVFRYDPLARSVSAPAGFVVHPFRCIEDFSPTQLVQLESAFGERRMKTNLIAIEHCGCVLWVGFLGDEPACTRMSRASSAVPHWFVDLAPDDVVFLRGFTVPKHRGKGLSPALNQAMASHYPTEHINIYSDCSVHNHSSVRSMEKTGYIIVAKKRAIQETWPTEL